MILSINLRTEHGCPGWFTLNSQEEPVRLLFRAKTHDKVEAFLGNSARGASELPTGFAVQKRALQKQPWVFGKYLYLAANGLMIQARDGSEYHWPIALKQSIVCIALATKGKLYSYIVVEPSEDSRFKYMPVFIE